MLVEASNKQTPCEMWFSAAARLRASNPNNPPVSGGTYSSQLVEIAPLSIPAAEAMPEGVIVSPVAG